MRTGGGIVCFGEVLLRLAAPNAQLLLQTPTLEASWGGAEANVAVSLAQLGHRTRMLTALPDTALGLAARDELRRRGVGVDNIVFAPGRLGLYFLTPGAGARCAEIIYDRADSVFARMDSGAFDWSAALDGADWLHVSGVTAALGPGSAEAAIAAARGAREKGLKVSFDCNFRPKLWADRIGEAPPVLRELLSQADLAFCERRDLGIALERDFTEDAEAAAAAFAAFPRLSRVAATRRVERSGDHHQLSATMYGRERAWSTPAIELTRIVDRIGAGDAFAAGLIHGLRKEMDDEAALQFAFAACVLKHAIPGDANLAREEDVLAVIAGEFGVRR